MPTTFGHVNLVARDWRRLVRFYSDVFGCEPVPPERSLRGEWLDAATGIEEARIEGVHLRLPGGGQHGPTLEVFSYLSGMDEAATSLNATGFSHLAFAVDDVEATLADIVAAGGSELGALTRTTIPGAGPLTFQYARDPEGNIIEVQRWTGS